MDLPKEAALQSRRQYLKKAADVAPVVITASIRPAFAASPYGGGGEEPPPDDKVRLPPRYVGRT